MSEANVPDLNTIFAGTPKFPGTTIPVAGLSIIVPKLSLGGIDRHKDFIASQADRIAEAKTKPGGSFVLMTESIPVIADAIRRNYPDATDAIVAELVDAENYGDFFGAAFRSKAADTAGEAEPATT
jgi:hypothetical protein